MPDECRCTLRDTLSGNKGPQRKPFTRLTLTCQSIHQEDYGTMLDSTGKVSDVIVKGVPGRSTGA